MQNKLGIWLEVVLGSTKIKVSRNNWNLCSSDYYIFMQHAVDYHVFVEILI